MQTDPNYLNPNAGTFVYANFGKRLVAYIIDGLILSVPFIILMSVFGVGFGAMMGMGAGSSYGDEEAVAAASAMMGSMFLIYIIWFAVVVLYYAYFDSSEKQATLGKQAMGIKVVSLNGTRISFTNALGREASKIILGAICFLVYLVAAFTDKKQGLHDMIAGTLVVEK